MNFQEATKSSKFRNDQNKAFFNLLYTHNVIRHRVTQFFKKHNLTIEQYNVLRIIRGSGPNPINVKEVNMRMLDRNSNTTRILDKLEIKKLVIRKNSPRDKRELYLELTRESLNLIERVNADMENSKIDELFLVNEDAILLNNLLDKIK